MARVIAAFAENKNVQLNVCFTGQHKEMVLPLLDFFEIRVDKSLDIMQPDQTLAGLSGRSLIALDEYFSEIKPDVVFVQGDTTTAMCAATAAFYRRIKIAHVEAGLRTNNIFSPFPEEFNRQVISKIADFNFAPTANSKQNLLAEHVDEKKILVTGNTVIDTLLFTINKTQEKVLKIVDGHNWISNGKKIILITGHRRENFGEGFENICEAIKELAIAYPEYNFIYPVHLNPNVQEPVLRLLSGIDNIFLLPPLDYIDFTRLMSLSHLIITDSGGVQEEAPALGKPVIILRDNTERPEAVEAGTAILAGTKKEEIIRSVKHILSDELAYNKMAMTKNPFGDGTAAIQISEFTINNL